MLTNIDTPSPLHTNEAQVLPCKWRDNLELIKYGTAPLGISPWTHATWSLNWTLDASQIILGDIPLAVCKYASEALGKNIHDLDSLVFNA